MIHLYFFSVASNFFDFMGKYTKHNIYFPGEKFSQKTQYGVSHFPTAGNTQV